MATALTAQAMLNTLGRMISTGYFSGCLVHLFSSSITITNTTTLAQLQAIECTFAGYAPETVSTPSTPILGGPTGPAQTVFSATFNSTTSGGTGPIYGFFLTDPSGTQLLGADQFIVAPVAAPFPEPFVLTVSYTLL